MAKSSFIERNKAVHEAWNNELKLVQEGKGNKFGNSILRAFSDSGLDDRRNVVWLKLVLNNTNII